MKAILFLILFCTPYCCLAQLSVSASANALYTYANRSFAGALDVYHYNLKAENGYEFKAHLEYPLAFNKKFSLSSNLGFRNFRFHGRHYIELLSNPNPDEIDMMFRRYEWSTYSLNNALLSIGGLYETDKFRFLLLGQSSFLLNAKEEYQEVYLSDFFDGNVFFKKNQRAVDGLFNIINVGVSMEIDYRLYKKLYLNINSYIGISSMTQFEKLDYLYKAGTFGLGLKYTNFSTL